MNVGAADPNVESDGTAIGATPSGEEVEAGSAAGKGASPFLRLDGFTGPLDHLLMLARAQTIDLAGLSLTALVDQLSDALRGAPAAMPLGQKSDWLVMAAWLLQLRSRLLLPTASPAQQDATVEADELRGRLVALQAMQTWAAWLERRLQLGRDVFVRGQPEVFGVSVEATQAVDVIEFLWASLALFDDAAKSDTAMIYQPRWLNLYSVAEARDRILGLLAETPEGARFEQFLPEPPEIADNDLHCALRARSTWSSTFVASLELARQGNVVLVQGEHFQSIHVAPA